MEVSHRYPANNSSLCIIKQKAILLPFHLNEQKLFGINIFLCVCTLGAHFRGRTLLYRLQNGNNRTIHPSRICHGWNAVDVMPTHSALAFAPKNFEFHPVSSQTCSSMQKMKFISFFVGYDGTWKWNIANFLGCRMRRAMFNLLWMGKTIYWFKICKKSQILILFSKINYKNPSIHSSKPNRTSQNSTSCKIYCEYKFFIARRRAAHLRLEREKEIIVKSQLASCFCIYCYYSAATTRDSL